MLDTSALMSQCIPLVLFCLLLLVSNNISSTLLLQFYAVLSKDVDTICTRERVSVFTQLHYMIVLAYDTNTFTQHITTIHIYQWFHSVVILYYIL